MNPSLSFSLFASTTRSYQGYALLAIAHYLRMYFEGLLESNFQPIIPFPKENVGNLQGHFELKIMKINKIQKLEYIQSLLTFTATFVNQQNQIRFI